MGKSIVLSAVAAIALGASAASADAAVYDWSYTLTDGGGSGSGTFIAPAFTGTPVLISSAMGTIYSDPGLGAGPFIVTGLSGYAAADNTIYALGFDAPGQLSQGGISLATAAGVDQPRRLPRSDQSRRHKLGSKSAGNSPVYLWRGYHHHRSARSFDLGDDGSRLRRSWFCGLPRPAVGSEDRLRLRFRKNVRPAVLGRLLFARQGKPLLGALNRLSDSTGV